MKTNAYLRWSLLIPFLVWGVLLLMVMIAGTLSPDGFAPDETVSSIDSILLFLMFYIFGILVWFVPYILLALILFFWSFISRARTTLKVFALSPLAMTMLTIAALNVLMLGTGGQSSFFTSPGAIDQDFLGLNIMGVIFTLIWGYVCVGLGYGIYKFLQNRGWIRDEEQKDVPVTFHEAV